MRVVTEFVHNLMQSFLSKEMMYSCAYWGDEEGGVRGDLVAGPTPGDLESAQHRKIHRILRHARVKRGDRLLEIGSGWGAMAIEVRVLYVLWSERLSTVLFRITFRIHSYLRGRTCAGSTLGVHG